MIRRLGDRFSRLSERFIPHPFVFAILLSLLTFLLGLVWTRTAPGALLTAWYEGLTDKGGMVFAFQMALILITGHALAETRPVRNALDRLAGLARGTASAAVLTSLTAMVAALVNWGLGLIVGALLAREVAATARRRGLTVHYPLIVAAGYTGLLIWHGGLSGSAPLAVASPHHPLEAMMGRIPIAQTLFSPMNLIVTLFLLLAVPAALALMAPKDPAATEPAASPPEAPAAGPAPDARPRTPARALDRSRVLAGLVVLGGACFLVPYFIARGSGGVTLNAMIFVFLLLGLLLHGSPLRYAQSVDEAARGAGGILLQFPFYFGILGMMNGAGLVARFAHLFVAGSEALARAGVPVGSAHAMLTFVSAAVVNLFVPSGGGQWAVQGPIMIQAAEKLGTHLPTTVMALAYGDELTNMLQPFWALPLLAVTGLPARKIVGYTALLMLLVTPGYLLLLALFGA
jgi:short-chain fatty acids transporter